MAIAGLAAVLALSLTPAAADVSDTLRNHIRAYVLSLQAPDFITYTHPVYGFSFDIPTDFLVTASADENGSYVNAAHHQLQMGFEIAIQPWWEDEAAALSPTLIQEEHPELVMEDTIPTYLGDSTPALRFSSRDSLVGETRELWFVRDGYLYQVTMYAPHQEWLDAWIRWLAQTIRWAYFGET